MTKKAMAILFGVFLSAFLLLGTLYVQCVSPGMMTRRFEAFATVEKTPEEFRVIAQGITGYLKGQSDLPPLFQPNEIKHMQDVQALVRLLKTVLVLLLALMAVLWLLGLRQGPYRLIRRALLGTLIAVLLAALYALIDFHGLFVLFHKLLFTNDLWLLNPKTDLLIQLMPIGFFMAYALSTGLIYVFLTVIAMALLRRAERNNGGLFPKQPGGAQKPSK